MNPLAQHIVNVSGGKDSTAVYLLALERGRPFRAVTADTGHEHPITYEFIRRLTERTGGPEVEVVRADFSRLMAGKRQFIATKWREQGMPEARVLRALELMRPTGNPFLDMCIYHGRFPSTQARFCTDELKHRPLHEQVIDPARLSGPVIQWLGERREESPNRANLPPLHRVRTPDQHPMALWRPILDWTAADVFERHRRHGVKPNPLYLEGASRVGCAPCIMARKDELRLFAIRYPEVFERLREWEEIVADASKRGLATFFAADKTPEGAAMAKRGAKSGYPDALAIRDWSMTVRGGWQFDLLAAADDGVSCTSMYGLCE